MNASISLKAPGRVRSMGHGRAGGKDRIPLDPSRGRRVRHAVRARPLALRTGRTLFRA